MCPGFWAHITAGAFHHPSLRFLLRAGSNAAATFSLIIRQKFSVHGEGYPVAHIGGVVADALQVFGDHQHV